MANGVLRSWICENRACGLWFDAWESNPECPKCRCVRVSWRPAGGHIAGVSKTGDAELRALADVFRMTDMNSAQEGRAAKKVATSQADATGPVHTFAPGFSAPLGALGAAACVPTSSHVDFKAKVGVGNKLAPSKVFPGVASNTAIEAAHKP